MCAQDTNSIDVFVKGADGTLGYKHWDGTKWPPTWGSIGGVLTSDPAATSSATGHIDVFIHAAVAP
ncbi:MAG: hypothetical protein ACXV3E_03440 [Halobacteriota archaeon]